MATVDYQLNWTKKLIAQPNAASEPLLLPKHFNEFSVGICNTPGTAIIQFSLSSHIDIAAGNGQWHDWPLGNVQKGVDGLNFPIMAVRIVSTSANPKTMEICG